MTIPLGIILGLITVILIVYPFFKPGARDIPGDGVLEEEVEIHQIYIIQKHSLMVGS